ncbi:uL4 family ribosomal protein, partial [Acinetobacter baumannii]|nr:uL4 family ribosomal protein [Acinetobacter baumannii]
ALSYKAQNNEIVVVEDFTLDTPKTKAFAEIINNLKVSDKKVLMVLPGSDKNVYLSARNLPTAKVAIASDINTYGVLNAGVMVVTEEALSKIE